MPAGLAGYNAWSMCCLGGVGYRWTEMHCSPVFNGNLTPSGDVVKVTSGQNVTKFKGFNFVVRLLFSFFLVSLFWKSQYFTTDSWHVKMEHGDITCYQVYLMMVKLLFKTVWDWFVILRFLRFLESVSKTIYFLPTEWVTNFIHTRY